MDLKSILNRIDEIGAGKDDEKVLEDIKFYVFKQQLKRLVNSIEIFINIEERIKDEIENADIKGLIDIHKTLIKSIDNIQSILRQFEPALREDVDIKKVVKELGIEDTDDPKQILKKVITNQIIALLEQTFEVQQQLTKYKQGSLQSWKAQESLKSLTQVIGDLAKILERFKEDVEEEDGIQMKTIIDLYEKIKNK